MHSPYLVTKGDNAELVAASQLLHHELQRLLQQREMLLHAPAADKNEAMIALARVALRLTSCR